MFTPGTSPIPELFTKSSYTNGEALAFFLVRNPIQTIITAVLSASRDPDNSSPTFWEALEYMHDEHGFDGMEEDPSAMDAIDLLGAYLIEEIDKELNTVFDRIGVNKEDQYDFFFSRWLSPTTVVLAPLTGLSAQSLDGLPQYNREEKWL